MDEQAKFFVGFYHQSNAFYERAEQAAEAAADIPDAVENKQ